LKNLKYHQLSYIIAICLGTLFVGCGEDTNEFLSEVTSNENEMDRSTLSTKDENFEITSTDSEESPQTISSIESEEAVSAEEDEQTEFYTIEGDYTTVLDGTYDLIANWDGQNYLYNPYGPLGLDEFIFQNDCPVGERLSLIGYSFVDINDDGSEELLIGPVDDDNHSISGIWGIYTVADGKITLVKQGWLRNRVYLLKDNTVYNEWDDGASQWGFNTYTLNPETGSLENVDCYFCQAINIDGTDEWVEAWFYNNIGSWDYNESTKLDWTYEEGMEFFNEYRTKIKDLEFTSFADYELVNAK
jgi:hypothetical protein